MRIEGGKILFYSVIIGKETAYVDSDYCFLLYTRCWCVSSCTRILSLAFIHEKINEKIFKLLLICSVHESIFLFCLFVDG